MQQGAGRSLSLRTCSPTSEQKIGHQACRITTPLKQCKLRVHSTRYRTPFVIRLYAIQSGACHIASLRVLHKTLCGDRYPPTCHHGLLDDDSLICEFGYCVKYRHSRDSLAIWKLSFPNEFACQLFDRGSERLQRDSSSLQRHSWQKPVSTGQSVETVV